jgi:hypothetical protein
VVVRLGFVGSSDGDFFFRPRFVSEKKIVVFLKKGGAISRVQTRSFIVQITVADKSSRVPVNFSH